MNSRPKLEAKVEETKMMARIGDITMLHKSEHFVVVNKHHDVKINSDDPEDTVTVETQLRQLYPEAVDPTTAHGFRFPHRLDYATSGALCVALTKTGARWSFKAFSQHSVTKHYLALVRGTIDIEGSPVEIDIAVGRDSSVTDRCKMCTVDSATCDSPRSAKSTVYVLEHGFYDGEPATKILLIPVTGRTHQLRVHCSHMGHLIVGDFTYSDRKDNQPYRMMLHAHRLVIPIKNEPIDVTAPDPFTTSTDPLWRASHVFQTYSDCIKTNEREHSAEGASAPTYHAGSKPYD